MSAAPQIEIPEAALFGFDVEFERDRLLGVLDPAKLAQNTPIWFRGRIGRETGSKIPKILGISQWGDPESAMRDDVRAYNQLPSDFRGNIATEWGTNNEQIAHRRAEEEREDVLTDVGMIVHPAYPWLAESPDGIWFSNGAPNQTKCPFGKRKDRSPKFATAAERLDYLAQMQLSMEVTGADHCTFTQWTPFALSIEIVERNPDWFEQVFPILEAYHLRYLEIIADPELSAPYLADKKSGTQEREDDPWRTAAGEYLVAKAAEDAAKLNTSDKREALVALSTEKTTKGCGVVVKTFERQGSINWEKVRKAYPEVFAAIDLDSYRGASTEQTTVTVDKGAGS